MKKLLITLALILGVGLTASVAYAVAFNSSQVGGSPSSGYVLQTNGTASTWVATSTLGISGGSGSGCGTNPCTATYFVATSTTATSTFPNLETVRYADNFSGADIGAKVNAAYASCPSIGCEIDVPLGTYSFTTPIVFGTAGKIVHLVCPAGGGYFDNSGTVLQYTGTTGTSTTFNTNNFVTAGSGISNCSFVGPVGSGNPGQVATSTDAIYTGGNNGAFGFHLDNVHISGFGTGVDVGKNTSFLNITNSVINENATNIQELNQFAGASGENMRVSQSVIADANNALNSAPKENYCVNIQLSGNVQWTFLGNSIDDCQIYQNQFGGTANIINLTNNHFENPNGDTYAYVNMLSNQPADVIHSTGNDFMNDATSGTLTEYVTMGGEFDSVNDTVEVNNNTLNPAQKFVTMWDNSTVDKMSWTGLTQKSANSSVSKAITYVYGTVPYAPDGFGTGLTGYGPSFVVNVPGASDNGTTTIANFGGILDATTFPGSDIGAEVNNAYADCPKLACIITIPRGQYSYSTGIVFGTDGKRALLEGTPAEGTQLNYTGSGPAITINTGDQQTGIDHTAGNGVTDIYFKGNSYATSTSPVQVGVLLGGTNGVDGAVLDNVNIFHFGYGLQTATSTYHSVFQNGVIRDNGQNVHLDASAGNTGSGESIGFINAFIVDGANQNPIDCIWGDNSAVASLTFTAGSIDDCQVHLLQANNVYFTGIHFENPGWSGWGPYPYINIGNNAANETVINGSTFFNDAVAATSSPSNFVIGGGNFTLNGIVVRPFGGFQVTSFLGLLSTGHATWEGFNSAAGAGNVYGVTNVTSGVPLSSNGSTASSTFASPFYLTGITGSTQCLHVDTTGLISGTGSDCGSGGGSSSTPQWLIGSGFIYNATTTDLVGIGSSTPNFTLSVSGKGGVSPFGIASSSGLTMLTVDKNSNLTSQGYFTHFGSSTCAVGNSTVGGNGLEICGSDNTAAGVNLILSNTNPGTQAFSDLFMQNDISNLSNYGVVNYNSNEYNNAGFGAIINIPDQLSLQNTAGPVLILSATTSNGYINFATGGTATGNERMRITSNGLVGIGSTTPLSALSVQQSNANGGILSLQNTSNTGYTAVDLYNDAGFKLAGFGEGNSGVGNPFKNNFYFNTNGTANDVVFMPDGIEGLRAHSDGTNSYIGISSTTPNATLAISGVGGKNPFDIASSTGLDMLKFTQAGFFGLGSSTPGVAFVVSSSTATSTFMSFNPSPAAGANILQIASSTSASSTLFSVSQGGLITTGGGVPVLSSCGTSPSLSTNANDTAGTINVGSVSATTCTLTWSTPKPTTPVCTVTSETGTIAVSYTESTSALVVTNASLTSDHVDYMCTQ